MSILSEKNHPYNGYMARILKYRWLILILALALGLRMIHLSGSFWLDEAAQAIESSRPFSQQLQIAQDFQPPLLHLILHPATWFGHSEWWLRLIGAVIPGLATILFTYKIAKEHLSERMAIISSLLLATSSLHLYFSQELRPYALPAMLAVVSWWLLLRAWKNQKEKKWPIALIVFSALGLFSTYLYPFLLISQWLVALFLFSNKRLKMTGWFFVTGLLFLPWLPFFLNQLQIGQTLRTTLPGWELVVSTPQLKAPILVVAKFLFGIVDLELGFMFVTTAALILGVLAYLIWQAWASSQVTNREKLMVVVSWFFLPLLLAWLISWIVPVLQPKRVLFLLPAFYLLASIGIDWGLRQKRIITKRLGQLTFACLLAINIWGVAQYATNPLLQREDWREAIRTLKADFQSSETIAVFSFPESFAPWRWYGNDEITTLGIGPVGSLEMSEISDLLKPINEYKYVISFDYLTDLTDPQKRVHEEILKYGFVEAELYDYPNIGYIRTYVRPEELLSQLPLLNNNSRHVKMVSR